MALNKIKVANILMGGAVAMGILIRYTDGTVELLAHQLVFAPYETSHFKRYL